MLKEKISLKRLVGLSQEDGEKLLLAAGYIQDNTYCDDKFIESHWDGLYERVVKQ